MGRRKKQKKPAPQAGSWYANKRPVFLFGLRFCASLGVLYLLSLTPLYQQTVSRLPVADARLASGILRALGETNAVSDATLHSTRCAITVEPGCSGIGLSFFLVSAILAFPVSWKSRAFGIIAGVSLLLLLNVVRVASLYWIGVHAPPFFDAAHHEIWPAFLNLAAVCVMTLWIVLVRPWHLPENHAP
jgi:exosortase/archaeosortase family protein